MEKNSAFSLSQKLRRQKERRSIFQNPALKMEMKSIIFLGDCSKLWNLIEQPLKEFLLIDSLLDDTGGHTPLSLAASMGHVEIICLLVEKAKANVDQPDARGQTPLQIAMAKDQEKALEVLLSLGAVPPSELFKRQINQRIAIEKKTIGCPLPVLLRREGGKIPHIIRDLMDFIYQLNITKYPRDLFYRDCIDKKMKDTLDDSCLILNNPNLRYNLDKLFASKTPEHIPYFAGSLMIRVFKDLPLPLLPMSYHKDLSDCKEIREIQSLLEEFPIANQNVLVQLFNFLRKIWMSSGKQSDLLEQMSKDWCAALSHGKITNYSVVKLMISQDSLTVIDHKKMDDITTTTIETSSSRFEPDNITPLHPQRTSLKTGSRSSPPSPREAETTAMPSVPSVVSLKPTPTSQTLPPAPVPQPPPTPTVSQAAAPSAPHRFSPSPAPTIGSAGAPVAPQTSANPIPVNVLVHEPTKKVFKKKKQPISLADAINKKPEEIEVPMDDSKHRSLFDKQFPTRECRRGVTSRASSGDEKMSFEEHVFLLHDYLSSKKLQIDPKSVSPSAYEHIIQELCMGHADELYADNLKIQVVQHLYDQESTRENGKEYLQFILSDENNGDSLQISAISDILKIKIVLITVIKTEKKVTTAAHYFKPVKGPSPQKSIVLASCDNNFYQLSSTSHEKYETREYQIYFEPYRHDQVVGTVKLQDNELVFALFRKVEKVLNVEQAFYLSRVSVYSDRPPKKKPILNPQKRELITSVFGKDRPSYYVLVSFLGEGPKR